MCDSRQVQGMVTHTTFSPSTGWNSGLYPKNADRKTDRQTYPPEVCGCLDLPDRLHQGITDDNADVSPRVPVMQIKVHMLRCASIKNVCVCLCVWVSVWGWESALICTLWFCVPMCVCVHTCVRVCECVCLSVYKSVLNSILVIVLVHCNVSDSIWFLRMHWRFYV